MALYTQELLFQSTYMPEQFSFNDLRELFAKANEEKSGDRLAGIAADRNAKGSRQNVNSRICRSMKSCGSP